MEAKQHQLQKFEPRGARQGGGGENPSAPARTEYTHIENDKLSFVDPDLLSFDDFQKKKESWIKEPNHPEDLFHAVNEPEWMAQNKDWLFLPNAETMEELLSVVNHTERPSQFMNSGSVGTRVRSGEVLFATNRQDQIVYGPGMHNFFFNTFTSRDGAVVNLNNTEIVQKGNISIITLKPDQIAVALLNRKPIVLLPGRHAFHDSEFSFRREDTFTVNDDCCVQKHGVTIVLVPAGQVGLAQLAGGEMLLKSGLHVSKSPSFTFQKNVSTRTLKSVTDELKEEQGDFLMHDNIAMVRVAQSQYGCAFVSGEPVLLTAGLHVYNNPSFSFIRHVEQTESVMKFENIHIVQVKPNQIGLAWEGNQPILMGPGIWHKNSPRFRFEVFRFATDQVIEHGSITRFQVKHGEIGFAWQDGQVMELAPGIKLVDDPNFKFERTYTVSQEVIQFGNIAHVTTREGHCRPVYVDGKLLILRAGYRKFVAPNMVVGECFPTGEIIAPLSQIEVLTRDRTPMLVTGQVTYQISTPEDLILNLGYDHLVSGLERTTDAILRHAFSITDLSTISPDTNHPQHGDQAPVQESNEKTPFPAFRREEESEEGQSFQSALCYSVKKELSSSTDSWGIVIKDVAISDIKFKDRDVATKLAAATSNTRTAEAEFDLTLAKNKIRLETAQVEAREREIEQLNAAKLKRIDIESQSEMRLLEEKANAEATAVLANRLIETENSAVKSKAQASANQVRLAAEAEAMKITAIAKAKRDAALLQAEGQKALAEAQIARYSSADAVLQLEMMKLWVDGAKALSQAPQPAVLLQSGGGADDNALLQVFRNQGKALLAAAVQKDKLIKTARK